uniref:Uncharacterized protein n=1 Tax=Brassica oleracea TaxID=3712 RepID=A0A3P6CR89_BRAOL|nr:unnamed protein product [Brassica oleracea]
MSKTLRKQGPVKHWPLDQFPCGIRWEQTKLRGETNQSLIKMSALNDLILRNPALGREKNKELVEWMLESRFAERIKDTGLLVKGLSPQMIRRRSEEDSGRINGFRESDDAKERRRAGKELEVLAHEVAEEGGSSHSNITSLLEDKK